jgi:cell division septum initiation protein DivIVA
MTPEHGKLKSGGGLPTLLLGHTAHCRETAEMSDAIAPVPISDETTRRLFGEPAFRVAKRGGYDPGDVAEFLGGLGSQMVTLIGRLRKAESEVDVMRTEVGHWQARTRDAEATRETFERTLALAEDTANAAIADARHRAAGIITKAEANADELIGQARHQSFHMVEQAREEAQRCYADERMKVREEWQRVQDESAQLETLRLAVAAETMALEEVRNQLRTRIRLAATEMLKVAESPDCLGTPIARGMPEKPRAEVAPTAPVQIAEASVVDVASEKAQAAIEAVELPTAAAEITEVATPEPAPVTDAAGPIAGEGFGNPAADAAFERFMSEDIADEPSREWILAG